MTIERLAQFIAETRVLTDISYYAALTEISSAQAKTGTYSYRITESDGPFGASLVVPQAAVRMGYWHYMATTQISDTCLIYQAGDGLGFSGTVSLICIEIDDDTGLLTVRRNGSSGTVSDILTTSPIPSQYGITGSWFHVGITHKVHQTDGFLSVYINGNRVLNYLGDTRPSYDDGAAAAYQTSVSKVLGPGGISTSGIQGFDQAYIDDMFIDSIEGEADAPVPSRRFLMVLPTGAGVDDEWTPIPTVANYLNVDENPHDGDATYNKALSADLRDTFVMGDITLPVDHQIVAVIPSPFVKRLDSEIQHELSVHAWDGLQYEDSADLDLSMSYDIPIFARMTLQPDGSAWNETDFNAMQWGYRSRGTF